MFKKSILLLSFFIIFSCTNSKYEYIIKNDDFRKTIKSGYFLEQSKGLLIIILKTEIPKTH